MYLNAIFVVYTTFPMRYSLRWRSPPTKSAKRCKGKRNRKMNGKQHQLFINFIHRKVRYGMGRKKRTFANFFIPLSLSGLSSTKAGHKNIPAKNSQYKCSTICGFVSHHQNNNFWIFRCFFPDQHLFITCFKKRGLWVVDLRRATCRLSDTEQQEEESDFWKSEGSHIFAFSYFIFWF